MLNKFFAEEDGITMVECTFMLALCAVMCMGVIIEKSDPQMFMHVDSIASFSVGNK